jgi:L-ascorbate metabolism protein UlaG (beta-lactamase superfamily)
LLGAVEGDVTWLGHATVVVGAGGTRVVTDPVLRTRVGPLVRIVPPIEPEALDGIDAVLLSHLHADHADAPSLRRLAGSTPVLAPRGSGKWLAARGAREVHEMSPGDETRVGDLHVLATPAHHDARRPFSRSRAEPIGFVARASRSVYFAGDTDLFAGMGEAAGSVDVALLPVWGWGPSLGPGHLNPERAASAVAELGPGIAVPIHWGTFALHRPGPRLRDPEQPALEFAKLAAERAPGVEVRVLRPGERIELG